MDNKKLSAKGWEGLKNAAFVRPITDLERSKEIARMEMKGAYINRVGANSDNPNRKDQVLTKEQVDRIGGPFYECQMKPFVIDSCIFDRLRVTKDKTEEDGSAKGE